MPEEQTAENRQARRNARARAKQDAMRQTMPGSEGGPLKPELAAEDIGEADGHLLQFPTPPIVSGQSGDNLRTADEVIARLKPTTVMSCDGDWECQHEVVPGVVCQTNNGKNLKACCSCGHPRQ